MIKLPYPQIKPARAMPFPLRAPLAFLIWCRDKWPQMMAARLVTTGIKNDTMPQTMLVIARPEVLCIWLGIDGGGCCIMIEVLGQRAYSTSTIMLISTETFRGRAAAPRAVREWMPLSPKILTNKSETFFGSFDRNTVTI